MALKQLLRLLTQRKLHPDGRLQSMAPDLRPGTYPAIGEVDFGSLRRVVPISCNWGYDRGRPIDRYYIETFLQENAADVQGHVLEIGDDIYTRRFGGDRVAKRDVLHFEEGNPLATVVADLTHADHIPSDTFDCIIFTQTLHLIYDVQTALRTLQRILKPKGVLLTTVPGITQLSQHEWAESWFWRFTRFSVRRLFEEAFRPATIYVESHGNVLAASAFLYGIAVEELSVEELAYHDPNYEVVIAVRAVKAEATFGTEGR